MRKIKKHRITLKEAIDNIPHNECYCNDSGRCPYWNLRKFNKNKWNKLCDKYELLAPCYYGSMHILEYCSFLKTYLSIQDGCKDCGINEDITEAQKRIDPEHPDDPCHSAIPYRRRITNREYADMYKEKFPDEVELIDKIVEEDNIEYWHNREEKKDEH